MMQNPQTVKFNQSIRTQYPPQPIGQPILLSASRPLQYPPQIATFNSTQPINQSQAIPVPPRIIEPSQSYRPLPQSILLPSQQIYQPQTSFVHPQYLVQPVPVIRRHPQYDLNPNFDYESANLLCEAKIVESTVFCVVCGSEYKLSDKEQHVQKHIRKGHDRSINQTVIQKVEEYKKKESKPSLIVKPIVLPEEVDMHFDPNVYQVIQQTIYEDQQEQVKNDIGIGQDTNNSFNIFDNNVSISHNNVLNVNPNLPVQPNPFFSKQERFEEPQYYIPSFQIPAAPRVEEEYEPQIHENADFNPVIVENEPILPASHSINTTPAPKISQLLEESAVDKSQKARNLPPMEYQQPINNFTRYQDKNANKISSAPFVSEPLSPSYKNQQYQQPPHIIEPEVKLPIISEPQVNHHEPLLIQNEPIIHFDQQPNIINNIPSPSPFSKRQPIYVSLDNPIIEQRLESSQIPKASRNLTQSQSAHQIISSSHLPQQIHQAQPHQSQPHQIPTSTHPLPLEAPNEQVRSEYSGPHEVRPPSASNSKKSSINMSQFIRDLNADNPPMVFQDLKRNANQSQW